MNNDDLKSSLLKIEALNVVDEERLRQVLSVGETVDYYRGAFAAAFEIAQRTRSIDDFRDAWAYGQAAIAKT